MLKSGDGSQVIFLESLEELADCTFNNIEFTKPSKSAAGFQRDYHPPWIFLARGENDVYRMDDQAYRALKNAYRTSGKSLVAVDSLIEAIDSALKQEP